LTIMQRSRRSFRVFGPQAPRDFDELAPALQFARDSAQAEALALARGAGAADPQATCQVEETWSARGTPAAVLMEARVTARACGRPAIGP